MVYALVKQLDDQKLLFTTINDLFTDDVQDVRRNLVDQSESLIFQSNILIGKKSREILWRKGFYDFISLAKRFGATVKKTEKSTKDAPTVAAAAAAAATENYQSNELIALIFEGIAKYKSIVVRMEHVYQLDLRNIIDFSLLDPDDVETTIQCNVENDPSINFSLDTINYALETVHAALLSIGDLHRYFIDFNFDKPHIIRREFAAKFYFEAFKLNPKIGMAQNQLGTLYAGQHYDLDATYHYLYSLVCRIPFELSENNVVKIFVANSEYLELVKEDRMGVSVCDFLARFKLIVDIFFYDKDVTDFNALCHCMLIDMRTLLTTKRNQLSDDLLFKMIAILFFCMSKLMTKDSPKVYSLNAFLVAICSELVDSCTTNLEKFILARSKQNEAFQESYNVYFDLFDRDVRRSRENHKLLNTNGKTEPIRVYVGERSAPVNASQYSTDGVKSLTTQSQSSSVKSAKKRKNAENLASCSSTSSGAAAANDTLIAGHTKEIESSSDIKTPSSLPPIKKSADTSKRKVTKFRRRRKKLHSGDTDDDSDQLSYSESDESDYEMDSDFSSDDSSFRNSSSSDGDHDDDDDDDEEEDEKEIGKEIAKANGESKVNKYFFY